jgi:RNA recognition motif-containing protein
MPSSRKFNIFQFWRPPPVARLSQLRPITGNFDKMAEADTVLTAALPTESNQDDEMNPSVDERERKRKYDDGNDDDEKEDDTAPVVALHVVAPNDGHSVDTSTIMVTPNPTVYVKNLDWKLKKNLLKRGLYVLFSRYGKVVEIIALRRDGLRGQAFVIMQDVPSATAVIAHLSGYSFFGKDLILQYARSTSDRIARRDGTHRNIVPKHQRQKGMNVSTTPSATTADVSTRLVDSANDATNATKIEASTSMEPSFNITQEAAAMESSPPSKMLIVEQLPLDITYEMLHGLFSPYHEFVAIRMIPHLHLAFVEFQSEPYATVAYQALQNFALADHYKLVMKYGKE